MRVSDILESFDLQMLWSLAPEKKLELLNKYQIPVADTETYTINMALRKAVEGGLISAEEVLASSPFKSAQEFKDHEYQQRVAREQQLKDQAAANRPKISYRQNGDGSWNLTVDYPDGRRRVHTNRDKSALETLVKNRYS